MKYLVLIAMLAACAPEPEPPRTWTRQEIEERFDGIELRLERGRRSVEYYRSLRWFTEQRCARRAYMYAHLTQRVETQPAPRGAPQQPPTLPR